MVYLNILLILAFVLCGGLADDARQCKQCAGIIHTTPMNSTDKLPSCSSAKPTPCNGTAFGCTEFDGNVSIGNQNGTTNVTIKFQYCTASGQTICYNVTNTNVHNETSGLLKAFSAAGLGFGSGQLQDIDGRICMHGFSPVVSGQNKLFPSVVILVLALICQ